MTYIGQQPATTFDSGIQDRFTGLTTNTVTLTHEISAEEDILVVWNNIVQDKNTYSVGGTGNKTLTLGGTLVSADVVTVYYQNKVMQSVNPTAGSVGITELNVSDGSNGQALTTNGSGTLSFSSVGADADNYFATSGLSSKDLGTGLHIKIADTSASVNSAADELVIEGTSTVGMSFLTNNDQDSNITFGDSDNNERGRIQYAHDGNKMHFYTDGTERMRFTTDGCLKASTTSYTEAATGSFHELNQTTGNLILRMQNSNASPYGDVIAFSAAAPDNNSNYFFKCFDNVATRVNIFADGDIQNHDNSYGSTSDIKLKEQITDASSQWNDIKNLRVRKFKLKDDISSKGDSNELWRIGLIAQEAETVSPNLVKDNPDLDQLTNEPTGTTTKAIKYSILYMKAVKALQEAMAKIETLETEMTALKARVKTLEDA